MRSDSCWVAAPQPTPSAPAAPSRDWLAEVRAAGSLDDLRALYTEASKEGAPPEMAEAMKARANELAAAPAPAPAAAVEPGPDVDALWMQCVAAAPDGWSTTDLVKAFEARHHVPADDGTAAQFAEFLAALKDGTAVAPKSETPTLDALKEKAAAAEAGADPSKIPF